MSLIRWSQWGGCFDGYISVILSVGDDQKEISSMS